MIFRHSLLSIFRTPKKSILFLFLLTALSVFLCIGAGMFESAQNMLSDADQTFTSLVKLDYRMDMGNDEKAFYQKMNIELADFDYSSIEKDPNLNAVGIEKTAWAYTGKSNIKLANSPLYSYTIIRLGSIRLYEEGFYQGTVNEILFSRRVRENTYVLINVLDEQGESINCDFIPGHEYLIVGRIADGRSPTLIITPGFATDEDIPVIVDLTENPLFFETDAGKRLMDLQDAMAVVDSSLEVTTVTSLEATDPYYFNEILIKEGRSFEPSDYLKGNNEVILVSKDVAGILQVAIGDTIDLKLHYSKNGIGLTDYLKDTRYAKEGNYTIVGIFENKVDNKYRIYMPEADWIEQELHSTTLARFIVKNGKGDEFIQTHKKLLLPGMVLTLYDQGYQEAIKPVLALRNSAVMIIVLGCLTGSAILILFSYLFVIKQRDTLKTMLSLGTGRKRTINYILLGSILLLLAASGIGASISSGLLTGVTESIFEVMLQTYGTDLRYSERAIGLQRSFIPQVRMSEWLPLTVIGFILIVGFLLLYLFTFFCLRENPGLPIKKATIKNWINKRIAKTAKKEVIEETEEPKMTEMTEMTEKAGRSNGKRVAFGRVRPIPLKFALISLVRSPGRSLIIPAVSFILSAFIIYLGLLSGVQQEKLDTVYDRIPVTAYITTYKDETREISGLNLQYDIYKIIDPEYSYRLEYDWDMYEDLLENGPYTAVRAYEEREMLLSESEFYDEMQLYTAVHYEYMGIVKRIDGEVDETPDPVPNVRKHKGAYGFDWFFSEINRMPKLAYADDLRYTPDFFSNYNPEVEFLEDYSYDSLRQREDTGVISQSLAEAYDIHMGDTIRITAWMIVDESAVCSVIDFQVIGIYTSQWRSETIYIPWINSYEHAYIVDNYYTDSKEDDVGYYSIWNEYIPRRVGSATFTLKNTKELSAYRDYLENQGYSQMGRISSNRLAIVIQDKALEDTIQNLNNHIRLMETIKPIMLVLFGVIGFVISYLLIRHRIGELAIMRSMGSGKSNVFLSFFLEQLALFFVGLVPGVGYALLQPDKFLLYGTSLVYFIICYLFGSALALILMNRANMLGILFTKE